MAVSAIQDMIQSAQWAILDEDWAAAEKHLLRAQAEMAGMPDGTGLNGESIQWRDTVDKLLSRIASKRSASKGIVRTGITYRRAT